MLYTCHKYTFPHPTLYNTCITVEPLIMDTPKSRQPPYNGQTVRPLPIYCPYISSSEEGTTSKQWTKCSSPTCPLFRGSTVYKCKNHSIESNMDVGMQQAKNRGNKEIPLAILSRILAQSCVTLCLNYVGRVTHDCASILDSIAKGISLFPRFFACCIPTSIFE